MSPRYQRALVLGLGASGEAAARLLLREGAAVTALDRIESPCVAALRAAGARVMAGETDLPEGSFDVAVVSPGLSWDAPWLAAARARGIPLLAEVELGRRRFAGRVAAVTGTNGKSTVVKWMTEALQAAGLRAAPAGNYGPPACRVVAEQPDLDWLVLEVSSFQLETTQALRAEVSLCLNLLPNHLDRHGDFATYERMKARLFAHARPDDLCLAHESCGARLRDLSGGRGSWHSFGTTAAAEYVYREGRVTRGAETVGDLRGTYFGNDVLGANAAGVLGAWQGAGLSVDAALAAARAFRPLPHRMEQVAAARGVRCMNDSKATTLSALSAAVRMCGPGTRLIAGGLLKETELGGVKEMLAKHVVGVYLIGRASEQMAAAWSDVVPCHRCGTLDAAADRAWREARPGETILLSPGCASFDQFRNFEERGDRFREVARRLAGEQDDDK